MPHWLASLRRIASVDVATSGAARWLLILTASVLALSEMTFPTTYWSADELDTSYVAALYIAIERHLQIGRQLVLTRGPLGFIDWPMYLNRELLLIAVLVQVASALALGYLLVLLLTRCGLRLLGQLAVVGLLLLPGGGSFAAVNNASFRLLVIGVFLIITEGRWRSDEGPTSALVWVIGGVTLVAASLVKSSDGVAGSVIFLCFLISLGFQRRWREGLIFILSTGVTYVASFIAFGGGVVASLTFPFWAWQLVSGYGGAMSLDASGHLGQAASAVLVVIVVVMATWAVLRDRRLWAGAVAVVLIAVEAWKEGLVRADFGHVDFTLTACAWAALGAWFLITVSGETQRASIKHRERWLKWMVLAEAATGFVLFLHGLPLSQALPITTFRSELSSLNTGAHFVFSSSYANQMISAEGQGQLADQVVDPGLADLQPLVAGRSAFAWPWNTNAVLAADANLQMPPSPFEFATFTPKLDQADSIYFEQDGRPAVGLISPWAIDDRLPLQTAGETFRTLLYCYKASAEDGAFVLVVATTQRTCTPAPSTDLTPWTSTHTGSPITIPAIPGKLVFMQVRISHSLEGVVRSLTLRDVPLRLNALSNDGTWGQYRVVPSTLQDGVLVSTMATDPDQLANLWLTGGGADVKAVSIVADKPSAWHHNFSYRLFTVPAPPASVPGPVACANSQSTVIGHVDTTSSTSSGTLLNGWFATTPTAPHGGQISVAAQLPEGRVLPLDSFALPRPDVRAALHNAIPLLSGFAAFAPYPHPASLKIVVTRRDGPKCNVFGSIP